MGFLDRLLGRGKETASDVKSEADERREGTRGESGGMESRTERAEDMGQEARTEAAERMPDRDRDTS